INAMIDWLTDNHLWRSPVWAANKSPQVRQRSSGVFLAYQPHNSKIGEQRPTVVAEQNICWLHIAMDQTTLMCKLKGTSYLFDNGHRLGEGQGMALSQVLSQRPSRNQRHYEIGEIALFPEIVYRDNMRMVQFGYGSRLAPETLKVSRLFCQRVRQHL